MEFSLSIVLFQLINPALILVSQRSRCHPTKRAMNQGNNSMQRTPHTVISLLASLVLSSVSSLCQAGTNAVPEPTTEQHIKPACRLTHDSALPGHFILLRLCQLEQQSAAATTPASSSSTTPTATTSLHQADTE
jgi:hypothetical protein